MILREGSTGDMVKAVERIVGRPQRGFFDYAVTEAVRAYQGAHGLVPDGIAGMKTLACMGLVRDTDPRAPACVAALRDASAAFPGRSRLSDGIMGDMAHQARPSDHNQGNAVDITHDPAHGCNGETLSRQAISDARVTYVIYAGEIYNRARAGEGWRVYHGANQHQHHVHISVRADMRDDASPWPWAV